MMNKEFKFFYEGPHKASQGTREILVVVKCTSIRFRDDEAASLVAFNFNRDCLFQMVAGIGQAKQRKHTDLRSFILPGSEWCCGNHEKIPLFFRCSNGELVT